MIDRAAASVLGAVFGFLNSEVRLWSLEFRSFSSDPTGQEDRVLEFGGFAGR